MPPKDVWSEHCQVKPVLTILHKNKNFRLIGQKETLKSGTLE